MAGRMLSWTQYVGAQRAAAFLRSAPEMDDTLRRERMRADRSDLPFSLVRFALVAADARRSVLKKIEAALRQQLRATDYAGLLHDGRIGVILPDTPADGAWKVAENVRAALPQGVAAGEFEVYEYPLRQEPGLSPAGQPPQAAAVEVESLFIRPLPLWKRALDMLGAACGLILLSPLFAAVAIAIKLTMPGPVLFSQKRAGLGGKVFNIYKFRSMVVGAEAQQHALRGHSEQDGPAFKLRGDPRVTWLGHLLRKTSIDELPQLWNVLRGEMTLVGPRPLPCHESDGCRGWQRRRLEVTPGLTCIWQVEGRSRVTFDEWVRMDLKYVSRRSLATDLKLLVQTVPAVLTKKGAC